MKLLVRFFSFACFEAVDFFVKNAKISNNWIFGENKVKVKKITKYWKQLKKLQRVDKFNKVGEVGKVEKIWGGQTFYAVAANQRNRKAI